MKKFSRWIFSILIATVLLLFVGGVLYYQIQKKYLRTESEKDLLAIAQFKVNEIIAWRKERLGNGVIIMQRPFFLASVPKWVAAPDAQSKEQLLFQFRNLQAAYGYNDVMLVDPTGKIHLSLGGKTGWLQQDVRDAISVAFRNGQPGLSKLHTDEQQIPHLSTIVPFYSKRAGRTIPAGALVLRSNARTFLFPLVQSWPTPSRTAETLLVREENGNVLFLNELRHQKNSALQLRIPLSEVSLPASMAISGQEGIVEGQDYRGVEVLAVLKSIPNSPWFMIVKIDKSEALTVLQQVSTLILLLLIGLGFVSVAIMFGFWQANEKAHYRTLFLAEEKQRKVEARYATIFMSIGDGVIATDTAGRVELMNPVAERLTGWSAEAARGKLLEEVFQIINEETRKPIDVPVTAVIRDGLSVGLANHTLLISRDGTEVPIADSGAPIFDQDPQIISGVVLVFRDQTFERVAEKTLRESEQRYRKAQAMGHVGNWEYNLQTMQFWGSDEARRIYGFDLTREEFTTDEVENCIPDRERVHQALIDLIENGKEYNLEFQIQPKHSNHSRIIASVAELERDQHGNPLKVIGVIKDITDLKQAEIGMRKSEHLLQRIFDVLPVGLWLADKDGKLVGGNPKGIEIWGAAPLVPMEKYGLFKARRVPSGEAVAPDDWALVHTITKGETIVDEMLEIETFDGKTRTILNYTSPVLDETGAVEAAIIVNLDITDLHQVQKQLVESEMKFRNYIENAPDGVFVTDNDGNYLEVNLAATRITQYAHDVLLKMNIIDLIPSDFHEQALANFQRLQKEGFASGEFPFFTKHGEKRWWSVDAVKISENRFLGFTNDITDRKRAEEERNRLQDQLVQVQKMDAIGRLAGGVAHDFNNMLQAILGNTDLLLDDFSPDSPHLESLLEIHKAASRSADLTRQLLAFARKQTVAPKVINFNKVVTGMLRMLRRLIGEDIELAWLPDENLWNVNIDPSQVDQMLANLAVNARDAIAAEGKVTIETKNTIFDEVYCAEHVEFIPGHYVLLAVSDNGCGMDKETLADVFEPFFTTKKMGEGTGLGMATVYGIVKQNQGFINAYSEPGKGTTFKIYLPRYQEEATKVISTPVSAKRSGGTETVMLVEDEKSILNMGRLFLRRLGYEVITTNSPKEALELAGKYQNDIHLLITDVVMPELNGKELARQLDLLKPGIKCLFMSGYTANVIAHHGVLDEGVLFLQKPFSINDLAAKVREALES